MASPTSPAQTPGALPDRIAPADLRRRLDAGDALQLVDVREAAEFAAGRLAGARLIPQGQLGRRARELDRNRPVVLLCRSGKRSVEASKTLAAMGFADVACLDGGLTAWESADLPTERDPHAPWSLERQVRVAAGAVVLIGVALGFTVHPGFFGLSALAGAGVMISGITDWCGLGLLIARAPWNRRHHSGTCCSR